MAPLAIKVLPARGGVGLKAPHYKQILEERPNVGFFEVHAENYMGDGGPPLRYLEAICEHYPLSLHGVGLSIGAARPLDVEHLRRLRGLIDRYQPGHFSEHLAWSTHDTGFLNDLLPVPYTAETLQNVTSHIDQVQDTLGVQMLLENPTTYLAFAESTYAETDFITEVAKRTGCGLLLDVNNVFISATNQQWDRFKYIDAFPLHHVKEIHLAGFNPELDEKGRPLLIDTHDRPVDQDVWNLYDYAISRTGPVPTLIEWDSDVPSLEELLAEAQRAEAIMLRREHLAAAE
ncbi:MAG: DUF692 domain-containing protein [Aestuariivirga sp.]